MGEQKRTRLHGSDTELTQANVRRAATDQGLQIIFKGTGNSLTKMATLKLPSGQVVTDITFTTDQRGLNKAISKISALRTDKTNNNVHKGQKNLRAYAK